MLDADAALAPDEILVVSPRVIINMRHFVGMSFGSGSWIINLTGTVQYTVHDTQLTSHARLRLGVPAR